MRYENKTGKPIPVRYTTKAGYYNWTWVEPDEVVDISTNGEIYGLSKMETKAIEVKTPTVTIETKRKKPKKKKSKDV